ncbi:MAG TPA: HAMP domain-containing histidine kinase, partial [bacterium]|nr:HAMP domain-containing histidine kinase [bacterium]
GFSDLILSSYTDQLDPVIISNLREINDGCERLQNIINNLLKTSRLESPKLKPKLEKEDLSFLIKFSVHELQTLAERRNQSIKLDIQDEICVNIEKEEIHDVLSNLLINAIKYTPPMGKIEIKTELQDDSVVVSVIDNGIGFTNEQKNRIFKQFGKIERYGQGLDLGIDGTGLGLYISKRIVESHGGKVWMESEGKNKGASFYFTLPTVK